MVIEIERAHEIEGWMTRPELIWLAEQAQKCNCIYEIGCYYGRSTRVLADNCPGTVYAIDPWDGDYYSDNGHQVIIKYTVDVYNKFVDNMEPHILNKKVIPIKHKFSLRALHEAGACLFPDFVFIDGDHSYNTVLHDILDCIELRPKIIAGHDYTHTDWPGVNKAVNNVFKEEQINLVDSIWWVVL